MNEKKSINTGTIIVIAAVVLVGWYFLGGEYERYNKRQMEQTRQQIEQEAAKEMQRIERQVASDAVRQYEIAKRSGTAMDACVHAGLVAAAYIQAKDEANYKMWKSIENADCSTAGLPR